MLAIDHPAVDPVLPATDLRGPARGTAHARGVSRGRWLSLSWWAGGSGV